MSSFQKTPASHWRVNTNHYKSFFYGNPMKMCSKTHEPFFMAMKTAIFGFHGAKLRHEISMKFFTSYFHEP